MQRSQHADLLFLLSGILLLLSGSAVLAGDVHPTHEIQPAAIDTSYLRLIKPEAEITRPFGYVETPSNGSSVFGSMEVIGWAVGNMPIANLAILVDGEAVVQNVPLSVARPDVCAALGTFPNCPYVGFRTSLSTSFMLPGTHSIALRVTDTTGVSGTSLNMPLVVKANVEFNGNLEQPQEGQSFVGSLALSGWVVGSRTIQNVEVLVDGVGVGYADYGAYRPDVCVPYAGFGGCANSGFFFALNSNLFSAGAHTIQMRARDVGGVTFAFPAVPRTVIKPSSYVVGVLDSPSGPPPSDLSDLWISGWAVSPQGISRVEILVDDMVVANASLGAFRPDVCIALGSFPGCPNVGFEYRLYYSGLAQGPHQLRVQAVAVNGTSILLPAQGPIPFTVSSLIPTTTSTTTGSTTLFTTTTTSNETTTTLVSGTPAIYELSPYSTVVGGSGFILSILGTGFNSGSVVVFNGQERPTTYPGYGSTINATIQAGDIATVGAKPVLVKNGSLESNVLYFDVIDVPATITTTTIFSSTTTTPDQSTTTTLSPDQLQIVQIDPVSVYAGSGPFTLKVYGTGFNSGSQVIFGGVAKSTLLAAPLALFAQINGADILAAGYRAVVVRNADGKESPSVDFLVVPTGGITTTSTTTSTSTSSTTTITVPGTAPVITKLTPAQVPQGIGTAFTLNISGANFQPGCKVLIAQSDGAPYMELQANYISSNSVTTSVPTLFTDTAGFRPVKVRNLDMTESVGVAQLQVVAY